jgi:hypothetical protein
METITLTPQVLKNLKKQDTSVETFINHANQYIKAIIERRMLCKVDKVSNSGMSRTLAFFSCEKNKHINEYYYSNYYSVFKALGFKTSRNSDYFRINGCGMDMIWNTNYEICNDLRRMGFNVPTGAEQIRPTCL